MEQLRPWAPLNEVKNPFCAVDVFHCRSYRRSNQSGHLMAEKQRIHQAAQAQSLPERKR